MTMMNERLDYDFPRDTGPLTGPAAFPQMAPPMAPATGKYFNAIAPIAGSAAAGIFFYT